MWILIERLWGWKAFSLLGGDTKIDSLDEV